MLPDVSGDEAICTCGHCGSQFVYDPVTRRSRYVYVASDFEAAADRLIGRPLTRRETFEAIDAAGLGLRGRPALPASFFWLILVAMIGVIAITCACSSALALGPSMAQTRRQIAALNAGALTVSPAAATGADGSGRAGDAIALTEAAEAPPGGETGQPEMPAQAVGQIDPLQSPLQPPAVDQTTSPSGDVILATAIVPEQQSELPLPPTPVAAAPTYTPPPAEAISTPTLPPTFTPAPAVQAPTATISLTPSPGVLSSATPTATLSPVVTPSVTPTTPTLPIATITPTLTPTETGSSNIVTGPIVISTVVYLGSGMNNEADEYVEIDNRSGTNISMSNWTLRSAATKLVYAFPNGFVMLPDLVCRVYTNNAVPFGRCEPLLFGSFIPVWDNNGDVAELRDASGALISRYAYGTPPAGP